MNAAAGWIAVGTKSSTKSSLTLPKNTPTVRMRHVCPYCHASLVLEGYVFMHKKDEMFLCNTCQTQLVYEDKNSADNEFFMEVVDGDGVDHDRGDFDCSDDDEIAVLRDQVDEARPRELRKGDPVTVLMRGDKGGKKQKAGWLLCDPTIIQHGTSRSDDIYRYAVVFDVKPGVELVAHYYPPRVSTPKKNVRMRASEIKNMAQITLRRDHDLNAAQRISGHYRHNNYHLREETQRYNAFVETSGDHIVTKDFRTVITAPDIRRLGTNRPVNEQLVNFYIQLAVRKFSCEKTPILQFNSYFATKLMMTPDLSKFRNTRSKPYNTFVKQCNYFGVTRWTSRIDIFRYKLILVPVFMDSKDEDRRHCQILVIRIARRQRKGGKYCYKITLSNCCSMNIPNLALMKKMKAYLNLEHFAQHGYWMSQISKQIYSIDSNAKVPQQENCVDCGVYVCANAYYACLGFPLDTGFLSKQEDCNEFRKHMALSIADGDILSRFTYMADRMNALVDSL